MVRICGVLIVGVLACVCEDRSVAQVRFNKLPKATVQTRLGLFKGNDTRREITLKQMFAEAGCSADQLSEQAVPSRKQPNVICVLPGSTAETIVVGAHFDHVDAGDGIVDNWSGASLLPSLYESLAKLPRQHTYIFVGFTGEEAGLLGSKFYVERMSDEQRKKVEVMVNLDTLGLGPTKVWVKQSDPVLLGVLAQVARVTHSPVQSVELEGYGESDEESFIAQHMCSVVVHSLSPETKNVLHTSNDNPRAIHFEDYYETYRLLAAYLAVLDTQALPEPHVCKAEPMEMYGGRRRVRLPMRRP